MLSFHYTARNPSTGKHVKAEVQAESEQAAIKLIKAEGLTPVEIKVVGESFFHFGGFKRVKTRDKVLFSRQLATLLNAGLPLVQSLRSVNGQTKSKQLKIVVNQVITDVESGQALAASLGKHPKVFNQVFVSLVAAGEASGTLDLALERLANQQEKDADTVSKVRGALVYPIIVLVVMVGVLGFMLVKVLPQVKQLYDDMGSAQLPLVTRILISLSDFVINFWYVVILLVIILAVATTKWGRTLSGKRVMDKLKMRAWPISGLFMKMYMARFARTGTTLVASGVPLIQVLEITADAVNNVHIGGAIRRATEKVKSGKALGDALDGDPNFLELVPNMLKIGEQSGSIEQMMEKTAEYYEKEVDTEIKSIQTIIEPVMVVLMGIMAFTIVAAVLLPIYNLAGQTDNLV